MNKRKNYTIISPLNNICFMMHYWLNRNVTSETFDNGLVKCDKNKSFPILKEGFSVTFDIH